MKHKVTSTKRDVFVVLGCVVLVLANLGAVGSSGRRRAKEAVCLSNLYKWGVAWKSYTDDHDGLFTPDLGHHNCAALSRPELKVYYGNDKLLLCPEATRTYQQGAHNPFAAWCGSAPDDPLGNPACSYGINAWICSEVAAAYQTDEKMWKTPYVAGGANIPMVVDCAAYQNASPWHVDEPPLYDGEFIPGSSLNEMKRVCINRHVGVVNMVFLDFSVRKVGLKHLWRLKWHRQWDPEAPLPVWPEWMQNFKDY